MLSSLGLLFEGRLTDLTLEPRYGFFSPIESKFRSGWIVQPKFILFPKIIFSQILFPKWIFEGEQTDLAFASMGISLSYRIAVSVRPDRAVIGRVHGDSPALFSHPLLRTQVRSVSKHNLSAQKSGRLDFSPKKSNHNQCIGFPRIALPAGFGILF